MSTLTDAKTKAEQAIKDAEAELKAIQRKQSLEGKHDVLSAKLQARGATAKLHAKALTAIEKASKAIGDLKDATDSAHLKAEADTAASHLGRAQSHLVTQRNDFVPTAEDVAELAALAAEL